MKQIVQEVGKSEVSVFDINVPSIPANWYLVRVLYSCISPGTERMLRSFASQNIALKAKKRPDLVKKVIKKFQQDGLQSTMSLVKSKLGKPIPLGYSCVGKIVQAEIGSEFKVGQIVACAGAGIANHAEFIAAPPRLICPVPENCNLTLASISTLAAISLQGFREANLKIGETALILGGGILGKLLADICVASGIIPIIYEPNSVRAHQLSEGHKHTFSNVEDMRAQVKSKTYGYGVDAVFICAYTEDNGPVLEAINNLRDFGTIVVVGSVKTDIPRDAAYAKSARVIFSRSYGPGRHNDYYETQGIDFPREYVRFTIQRNMETVLQLISENKINLNLPVYPLEEATEAYDDLDKSQEILAAVFDCSTYAKKEVFNQPLKDIKRKPISARAAKYKDNYAKVWETYSKNPQICLVGVGEFSLGVLVPALKALKLPLTSFVSRDGAKSIYLKKLYPDAVGFQSLEEVFEHQPGSAVIISNRHSEHAKNVIKSLKGGALTFVEKPLCINWQEWEEISKVIEETGNIPFIGHNRRYSPMAVALKEELKKMSGPFHIVYRVHAGVLPSEHWVNQPKEGGRVMGEITHFVDLINFLMDSKIKSVYPFGNLNIGFDFEDGSSATIHYIQNNGSSMEKEILDVHTGGKTFTLHNFFELKGIDVSGKGKGHKEELNFLFKEPNLLTKIESSLHMLDSHELCLKLLDPEGAS